MDLKEYTNTLIKQDAGLSNKLNNILKRKRNCRRTKEKIKQERRLGLCRI